MMKAKNIVLGTVFAAASALGIMAAPQPAKADWACEVALCISNPAGPMAVSECVPPIKRLYRHLARGGSFPLCTSADGYVNFTRYGVERQEDCPEGTTAVYRNDDDRGFGRGQRYCRQFVPVGSGGTYPIYDRDDSNYVVRVIDGKRVYGRIVETRAPLRTKPRFLEYVVDGDNRRLWW